MLMGNGRKGKLFMTIVHFNIENALHLFGSLNLMLNVPRASVQQDRRKSTQLS